MVNPAKALEGADDGITAALELVLTPALFAFFGYLLDGWLGTGLVFTVALALIVFVYEVWKLAYAYTQKMKAYEAAITDTRGSRD